MLYHFRLNAGQRVRQSSISNQQSTVMSSPAVQPLLCLLGYPVGGNPTQYLIERVFAQHDLDWRYLTFEVRPEDLGDAVRGLRALGFRGGHCVGPHRQAVVPLLDRTTEAAAMIGSVNLLFREGEAFVGENTEGKGVAEAIRVALKQLPKPAGSCEAVREPAPQEQNAVAPSVSLETGEGRHEASETLAPQEQTATQSQDAPTPGTCTERGGRRQGWAAGRRGVLLGAGQLARAIAVELAAAGIAGLTIVDRTESRAAELAAIVSENFSVPATAAVWSGDYAAPSDVDMLIHATSLGEDEESPLPLAVESLRPGLLVADGSGRGGPTWLLDKAAGRGCVTVDRLAMFLEQIAISVRLWTGVDPDRQLLRDAAEEFLGL
ncbi:MAG: shikimate dehydrogenase [Planctomycetaceae bacterium]|nr:shikimate dehydrogenase [Planctomycetaceae bacterium]